MQLEALNKEQQPVVAGAGHLMQALSLPILEALDDNRSLQEQSPELLKAVQSAISAAHATQPHHTRGLQQLTPGSGSLFGAGTMLSSGQALRSLVSFSLGAY